MSASRITAIIFGALMSGLVAFGAVAATLVGSGRVAPMLAAAPASPGEASAGTAPDAPARDWATGAALAAGLSPVQVMAIVAVSLTLAAVPTAFFLRARMLLRLATPAQARWHAAHIAAGAVLEGTGLVSCVFALVTGQLAFLGGAALMLVSMAALFPTPARAEQWMEEESRLNP